jgi:hypothetical protein
MTSRRCSLPLTTSVFEYNVRQPDVGPINTATPIAKRNRVTEQLPPIVCLIAARKLECKTDWIQLTPQAYGHPGVLQMPPPLIHAAEL